MGSKKQIKNRYVKEKKKRKKDLIHAVINPQSFQEEFIKRVGDWMLRESPVSPESVPLTYEALLGIYQEIFLLRYGRGMDAIERGNADAFIKKVIEAA